jgi:prepilin-type N-terminal cleavage/methylation domain-containing protein
MNSKLTSLSRKGFTLMEMMVVLVIIGILSSALMPAINKALDSAKMTASERNMTKMFQDLVMYRTNGGGTVWPRENGPEFLLAPWRAKIFEHTPKNADVYFSPSLPFEEIVMEKDLDIVDYLDGPIGAYGEPNVISYAGFTMDGDSSVRKALNRSPGSITIASDSEWVHRSAIIYMRGDGAVARYPALEIEAETGLEFDSEEIFAPGPGCGIPELETVASY